jgi:putative hydrolase of the HAD superfamily
MAKFKAVLFDLDDTLLWDDRSINEAFQFTSEFAAQHCGFSATDFELRVRQEARELYSTFETFEFTKMIGINPFEGLWGHFVSGHQEEFRKMQQIVPYYRRESWTRALRAFNIDNEDLGEQLGEMFAAERRKRPYVYEETYEILNELKNKGYLLLLLTNGSPDLQREKLDGVPKLTSYFDHVVISGEFGKGKPDVSIFQYAIDLLGIKVEEGLMVGDKLTTDILGSSRLGMENVWINRHGMVRSDEIIPTYEIDHLTKLYNILDSNE